MKNEKRRDFLYGFIAGLVAVGAIAAVLLVIFMF